MNIDISIKVKSIPGHFDLVEGFVDAHDLVSWTCNNLDNRKQYGTSIIIPEPAKFDKDTATKVFKNLINSLVAFEEML